MSDLPDPLTPQDCDLRGFDWMALCGFRLFKSTFYRKARKDPRGGLAGIKLWWEAMLQKPAGSLPNDEEDLCMLADFGEDMKTWAKHRDTAMHGWVLCADGRLYHPVVAEQVITAWEQKRKARGKRDTDAERLRQWRARKGDHTPDDDPNGETHRETHNETRFNGSFETHRETPRKRERNTDETRKTVQDKVVEIFPKEKISTTYDRNTTETHRETRFTDRAEPRSGLDGQRVPLPPEDNPVDPEHVRQELAKLTAHLTRRPQYEIQEMPMTPEEQIRALGGT